MNEQTKKDILTWAQEQLGLWTSAHDDWWGAFNDEWDINIFDADVFSHEEQYRGKMCVTAYRMFTDEEGFLTTDMADFVELGACERPGHLVWPEADGYADEVTGIMETTNRKDKAMKTYTVDMTIRVYVEATSTADAESKAVDLYGRWSPDGIAQYGNVISREGMWYLCEHGDETDAQVWDPYKNASAGVTA